MAASRPISSPTAPELVPAHGDVMQSARAFVGAKVVRLLNHYQDNEGIPEFSKAVDWGWF